MLLRLPRPGGGTHSAHRGAASPPTPRSCMVRMQPAQHQGARSTAHLPAHPPRQNRDARKPQVTRARRGRAQDRPPAEAQAGTRLSSGAAFKMPLVQEKQNHQVPQSRSSGSGSEAGPLYCPCVPPTSHPQSRKPAGQLCPRDARPQCSWPQPAPAKVQLPVPTESDPEAPWPYCPKVDWV